MGAYLWVVHKCRPKWVTNTVSGINSWHPMGQSSSQPKKPSCFSLVGDGDGFEFWDGFGFFTKFSFRSKVQFCVSTACKKSCIQQWWWDQYNGDRGIIYVFGIWQQFADNLFITSFPWQFHPCLFPLAIPPWRYADHFASDHIASSLTSLEMRLDLLCLCHFSF